MFRVNEVHRVLTSATYMGLCRYNRKAARTRQLTDPKDWIEVPVPVIVEPDVWDRVQQHLQSRRPSVTPARITNGAMLLTGIAVCPHCSGGMMLGTGKSGQYRYYACANAATKGRTACKGRRIRMETLDEAVLSAFEGRVLSADRLPKLLEGITRHVLAEQSQNDDRER